VDRARVSTMSFGTMTFSQRRRHFVAVVLDPAMDHWEEGGSRNASPQLDPMAEMHDPSNWRCGTLAAGQSLVLDRCGASG
jgi:hypothetical protein